MQQLKKLMEKETGEVMRQLQHSRKSEVKQLALVHKDKDELERMKREVDSTLVEKGVAERVRLTASYERRRDDLQKQHDAVRTTLNDQRDKVNPANDPLSFELHLASSRSQIKSMLEKDVNSRACVSSESCMNFFNALIPPNSVSSISLSTETSAANTTNDVQASTNCFKT